MTSVVAEDLLPDPALNTDSIPKPHRTGSVLSLSKRGFHRIVYSEFGDPASQQVAICVHGLSRQGRDFDVLATEMAERGWRVICPDLAGRGRSDWLRDPEEYVLPQYATDMTVLLARLGVTKVDWIGTSLGGLIGMVIAGQPQSPIRRMVVNDIGPFLPWQALHRLGNTVRLNAREFPSFAVALAHYKAVLAPFGNLSETEWVHITKHSLAQTPSGRWRKIADPDITASFKQGWLFNLTLWNYWDAITCPVMALRGETSDLLLPSTAREMTWRGPKAELIEVAGCGHAPALMDPLQTGAILRWLEAHPVTP